MVNGDMMEGGHEGREDTIIRLEVRVAWAHSLRMVFSETLSEGPFHPF